MRKNNKPFKFSMPDLRKSQLRAAKAKTLLQHLCALDIDSDTTFVRLSSIVCTIGPASRDVAVLEGMLEAGMNVARIKMIPDSHEYHAETIANIRQAVENYNQKNRTSAELAIALDTKGPEVRSGILEVKDVELFKGDSIRLTTDPQYSLTGNAEILYVDYAKLPKVVSPGVLIYIDNGMIRLCVVDVGYNNVDCVIEQGGKLGDEKVINLPDVKVDLPSVSSKDRADLLFGVEQGVDMIFASFIRSRVAIEEIRTVLGHDGRNIFIVSKIENKEGIRFLDEIMDASDGIMVARGDLGVQIPLEKLFVAQKRLIAKCNMAGKPVICATQMLESMTDKPRPTRAESSDVANAILDGSDCVMLSGETAEGNYPLECVRVMANICREAEAAVWHRKLFADLTRNVKRPLERTQSVAIAAVDAAEQSLAAGIIVLTSTGRSAHLVSKYRPTCPILAVTRNPATARKSRLFRGIFPAVYDVQQRHVDWLRDVDARIVFGLRAGKKYGILNPNDSVVVVTGSASGAGHTNSMKVISVPEKLDDSVKFLHE